MKLKSFAEFLFTIGLFLIFIGLFLDKHETIEAIIQQYISPNTGDKSISEVNLYHRDYDFMFVQNTKNYIPHSYQDIINIIYTALNAGRDSFYFNCPKDYKDCFSDVEKLANDQTTLSDINNYVHPFNTFSHIGTSYNSIGTRIDVSITKSYPEKEIPMIVEKVNEIYNRLYREDYSLKDNIRSFHDYIINNSKYDSDRVDFGTIKYESDKAFGPLFEGYAICGGYTDLMQLFLEKLNVKNYRISSDGHIWNAVYIDGEWLHLDLTWDDPVTSDGKNYLEHSYFLINTNKLLSMGDTQHSFNRDKYLEFK